MRTLTQKAAMVFGVAFLLMGLLGLLLPGGTGMEAHPDQAPKLLVLALLAFIDPTTFGLVPIGGNDIWLHAGLALGLGYFGFIHREAGVPASS